MVNAVNWLKTKVVAKGEVLNLSKADFSDFVRELDMKSGEMTRKFNWNAAANQVLSITFKRILSIESPWAAYQTIYFEAIKGDFDISVDCELDFGIKHWNTFQFWEVTAQNHQGKSMYMLGELPTKQRLFSMFTLETNNNVLYEPIDRGLASGVNLAFQLKQDETNCILKKVTNLVEKNPKTTHRELIDKGCALHCDKLSYDGLLKSNRKFYEKTWDNIDIEIDGDLLNQQGIRFCLFQLTQTYHGFNETNNIGAKGLTGEAYSGHTFWDTETYCLPFYLFNDPKAAKSLLMYRYNTLNQAKLRAKELDCKGACYPIATINGEESCDLWQHASLQMQPSTAVSYGIMHYVKNTDDYDFLFDYGCEMLVEISRYILSRGDYNSDKTRFGFYGVMGPDEFQMMVNHNTYTNYMGKITLEDTLNALNLLKITDKNKYNLFVDRIGLDKAEIAAFENAAKKMFLLYDDETNLFEQHQGYYDLPHIEINDIPKNEFPLYHHWSYDRIYRNDMIKQPDVLMMMFLKNQSFTSEQKQANYEFYEPRCIHESSLSPSIHSVFAAELDKYQEALAFFGFATRLDLDNYNRNTLEGLHLTSIAAAWVNIVYGFGGLRSDGKYLTIYPKIPSIWHKYSFKIVYFNRILKIEVSQKEVMIDISDDLDRPVKIGEELHVLHKGQNRFIRSDRRIIDEKNRTEDISQE